MTVKSVVFQIDGRSVTLSLDSSTGYYTGTIAAPSATSGSNNSGKGPGVGANATGGYYPGTVVATDDAGNTTTVSTDDATYGNTLKLKVLEKTKPTVTIDSPGASARLTNSKPSITITASDAGSGIQAIYVKMDSGTAASVGGATTSSSSTVTYTPSTALAEGSHTVTVYAVDYDGNQSADASVSFYVDTVKPTLNVTSPADALVTNAASLTVAGTTNDATSSPVTITIKVGSTMYTPTVTNGAFRQAVTLSNGSNTITVTAKDAAGLETTLTRTVTLDTGAPVISEIILTPNAADAGATLTIKVKVTD